MSYYKEPKDINKSIRITKTVYDYIQSHDGNGFNDKLEKMVLKFRNDEKHLDDLIESKQHRLNLIIKQICDLLTLKDKLMRINRYIDYATEIVEDDMPSLLDNNDHTT